MSVQRITVNNQTADIEHPVEAEEISSCDFAISDENYNAIVVFENGHIKTKNFDSSKDATTEERGLMSATDKSKLNDIEEGAEVNDVETENQSYSDLDISDDNGNVLARFSGGHFETKNFDSSREKSKLDTIEEGAEVNDVNVINTQDNVDLDISDESGNALVRFQNGGIKTKNFNSSAIKIENLDNELKVNFVSLKGKSFSILGDSISTFRNISPSNYSSYYPNGDVAAISNTYWGKLIEHDGMVLVNNNSYGGSSVALASGSNTQIPLSNDARWSELGNPDIIIVFGGTNDFGLQHNPLGSYDYSGNYSDMKQFSVAYAYLLSQLVKTYTSAVIVCCTIPTRRNRISQNVYPIKQESVRDDVTDRTLHFMFEFNDIIKSLSINYGCYVCDWSNVFNFYDSSRFFVDGVIHPNNAGHELMYKHLRDTIIDIFNKK